MWCNSQPLWNQLTFAEVLPQQDYNVKSRFFYELLNSKLDVRYSYINN